MSAIKLRNPKENPAHLGFEKSKSRADQSHAFDGADNLLEYFENSALVPVYLNADGQDGERMSLPTNTTAQEILKQELSREAERLRANPSDLDLFYRRQLQYSLIKAASNKKTGSVLAIIDAAKKLENPEEILNHRDAVGNSALIWAAGIAGDIEATEALLRGGANIDQTTDMGGTALMFAIMNGKKDLVEKLVNYGAGINDFVNSYNQGTALNLALSLPENEKKHDILKSLLRGLIKEKAAFEEKNGDQKFELKGEMKKGDVLVVDSGIPKELRDLADRLTSKSTERSPSGSAEKPSAGPVVEKSFTKE